MAIVSRIKSTLKSAGNILFDLWLDVTFGKVHIPKLFSKTGCSRMTKSTVSRKLYECIACESIPEAQPIYMCSSGHTICNSCIALLTSCPSCAGSLEGKARNFLLESLVQTEKFQCRYFSNGCEQEMEGALLAIHEKTCMKRRATCNVKGYTCDGTWTGSIKALYAHYVTNHGMSLIFRKKNALFKAKIDPNSKNFVRLFEPAVLLKVVQGQNYILRATYIRKFDAVFVYLSALYREIEEGVSAEPATGELRLVTRPKVDLMAGGDTDRTFSKPALSWIGAVCSLDETPDEIALAQNGLMIPWANLLTDGLITEDVLLWEIQVEVEPAQPKPVKDSEQTSAKTWGSLIQETIQRSPWIVIAPTFTLLVMLYFLIFV